MSKLVEKGVEILETLSQIPEQTLQVRAAIAKSILLNNALRQVDYKELVVEEPKEKKTIFNRKKKASKKK